MCFVDLEMAFDHVPQGVLWGVLWENGVLDPLIHVRAWSAFAGSKLD